MSAEDFAPIKPQALAWIDRVMPTMPKNRAGRPSEDTALSAQANEAIRRLHQNVARILGDSVDTAPLSDGGGRGGVIKGLDIVEDDKLNWLADFVDVSEPIVEPESIKIAPSALEKRLARLGVKGIDHSPKGTGEGASRVDELHWIDGEYELFAGLPSKQRKDVWMALKSMNVTADQPSCGDLELLTGVSHTTCAKVLPLYRETHGLVGA